MKINNKSKVLLVSDSMSFQGRAYFYDSAGERLQNALGEDSMNCLGFHISSKPTM